MFCQMSSVSEFIMSPKCRVCRNALLSGKYCSCLKSRRNIRAILGSRDYLPTRLF
jgi:hypothetical protein